MNRREILAAGVVFPFGGMLAASPQVAQALVEDGADPHEVYGDEGPGLPALDNNAWLQSYLKGQVEKAVRIPLGEKPWWHISLYEGKNTHVGSESPEVALARLEDPSDNPPMSIGTLSAGKYNLLNKSTRRCDQVSSARTLWTRDEQSSHAEETNIVNLGFYCDNFHMGVGGDLYRMMELIPEFHPGDTHAKMLAETLLPSQAMMEMSISFVKRTVMVALGADERRFSEEARLQAQEMLVDLMFYLRNVRYGLIAEAHSQEGTYRGHPELTWMGIHQEVVIARLEQYEKAGRLDSMGRLLLGRFCQKT